MPLPRPRFSVRRLLIAVGIAAVIVALFAEARRSWLWHDHDQKEFGSLTIAAMLQETADRSLQAGLPARGAQFQARAQGLRDQARAHATAKNHIRPKGWSGDRIVWLLRLPLVTRLWLILACSITSVGGLVALLRRAARNRKTVLK